MSVTERMQALGDHAKSSRQPPLRPRQTAGGDLAAGSHFIHDNALTSPPIDDDDEMNALLHQAIEDRTAEELIIPESAAIKTRPLTLIDQGDPDDPTAMALPMLLNNAYWHDPVTENPTLGTTEIWSLINLTDDTHPIHLHQVRFQILDRRAFDVFTYQNENRLHYTAAAVPPDANELGWKDTVRADPGMVTRIIIRFEGFAGRFVWHCHVLEHEDFEMMRPYDILPAAKAQFIESA